MSKNEEYCFMCGTKKSDVAKLVKGRYGCICDNCIEIANGLLDDEESEYVSSNIKMMLEYK
jgi:ATP-dependent Clp protease ATP-binding subunit ClpX